ncbi:RNA-directed DNA polymerase, eukaryota, reverse transcriptase zinc-binding domain protein [Tanacetum coccineum]
MLVLKIAFGKFLMNSIKNGPYQMRKIMDPGNPDVVPPIELFLRTQTEDDLSDDEKEQIEADGYVMNCILLCIPNSIYITVDSYKTAKAMWGRVRRHIESTTLILHAYNQQTQTSSNTRNQAYVQGGRFDVQGKGTRNVSYAGNVGRNVENAGNAPRNVSYAINAPRVDGSKGCWGDAKNVKNAHTIKCNNFNGKGHYATDCPQPRVRDSNYFKEHMMIAKEDEVWISIIEEYNDFLEDIMSNEEQEELNVTCIMMARIQEVISDSEAAPYYDIDGLSKIPISETCFINDTFNHERKHPKQLKFINETYEMINLIAISYLIVLIHRLIVERLNK